ncbi:MAG: hypothetical protein CVV64_11065 [Candidatus Wallbacteria bacterium HGW-Wallbacteria-1]|jgi:Na+-transporting methylmalonyl-CoA/oxaloacetate decarboxylase gamma subunit|uniref:Uncharacterized protein n=1 Tax=Candidatus Wallbacteria bacterium HGW-Wallbacteria-1 TaxID=2013854 RepID=A0A2N1PP49_9BACT|nr:MAG: hypothetical protein CVV64_11065 [Candidatus Wallbacteria bacterium HGW-Wallbacteria-1]
MLGGGLTVRNFKWNAKESDEFDDNPNSLTGELKQEEALINLVVRPTATGNVWSRNSQFIVMKNSSEMVFSIPFSQVQDIILSAMTKNLSKTDSEGNVSTSEVSIFRVAINAVSKEKIILLETTVFLSARRLAEKSAISCNCKLRDLTGEREVVREPGDLDKPYHETMAVPQRGLPPVPSGLIHGTCDNGWRVDWTESQDAVDHKTGKSGKGYEGSAGCLYLLLLTIGLPVACVLFFDGVAVPVLFLCILACLLYFFMGSATRSLKIQKDKIIFSQQSAVAVNSEEIATRNLEQIIQIPSSRTNEKVYDHLLLVSDDRAIKIRGRKDALSFIKRFLDGAIYDLLGSGSGPFSGKPFPEATFQSFVSKIWRWAAQACLVSGAVLFVFGLLSWYDDHRILLTSKNFVADGQSMPAPPWGGSMDSTPQNAASATTSSKAAVTSAAPVKPVPINSKRRSMKMAKNANSSGSFVMYGSSQDKFRKANYLGKAVFTLNRNVWGSEGEFNCAISVYDKTSGKVVATIDEDFLVSEWYEENTTSTVQTEIFGLTLPDAGDYEIRVRLVLPKDAQDDLEDLTKSVTIHLENYRLSYRYALMVFLLGLFLLILQPSPVGSSFHTIKRIAAMLVVFSLIGSAVFEVSRPQYVLGHGHGVIGVHYHGYRSYHYGSSAGVRGFGARGFRSSGAGK